MKDRTLHKILGDPEFDPSIFLEDAIKEFVSKHPTQVAQDKVALRHLLEDIDVITNLVDAIDVHDVNMISKFMTTLAESEWQRNEACKNLVKRLAGEDLISAEVTGVVADYATTFPCLWCLSDSYGILAKVSNNFVGQLARSVVNGGGTRTWDYHDWRIALESGGVSPEDFVNALKKQKVSLIPITTTKRGRNDTTNFWTISEVAKAIAADESLRWLRNELLDACNERFDSYACFCCGKEPIKSISGYTLHLKSCDKGNQYPDPWQIFHGQPRELSFKCERCGQKFTTTSGLTLHSKKCQ